jgi:MFS family permease
MFEVLLRWWALMAAILAVQIGTGLAGLTISLRTEAAGFDAALTGWVIAAFYAGQILGPNIPPVILKWTRLTPAYFGFTIMAGASVASFTVSDDANAWIALRFLQGVGMSAMFTVVESWLNLATGDKWRARTFAVYIMTQLVGMILGQLGVNLGGTDGSLALLTGGLLLGGSGLLLILGRIPEPSIKDMMVLSPLALLRRAPGGALAIAVSGLNWAMIMGMGPIYAERMALTRWEISIFMALTVLGGLLAQFPLGYWADHSDRSRVLSVIAATATLVCLCPFLIMQRDVVALWALALAFGAMSFPVYAIAAAYVGECLEQDERVPASAAMVIFFGVGATLAPILGAQAMHTYGPPAMFALSAIAFGLMVLAFSGQRRSG